MKNEFKTLLESLDSLSNVEQTSPHPVLETTDDLGLLEEWQRFRLDEAPQPPATGAATPKVDPRTAATIQRVKAVTRAPINVPATANAMAKANAGARLNRIEQMNLGKLDQAVGNVTKQALFTPQTTGQTLTALQKATKMAQLAQAQSKK